MTVTIVVIVLVVLALNVAAVAIVHGAEKLNRRTRTHHRTDGPVLIDADLKHKIHVRD